LIWNWKRHFFICLFKLIEPHHKKPFQINPSTQAQFKKFLEKSNNNNKKPPKHTTKMHPLNKKPPIKTNAKD
jgi:hypothetical protein